MTTEVAVLGVKQTVRDAARTMSELNIGFLPVCDASESVVGVLTDRDIAIRVVAEERPWDTAVEDVMTEEVVSCNPKDDIRLAEERMRVNQKARIVCIDETGRVAGVISYSDIAHAEDERRTGEVIADITEREADVH
jgi:CBS domain-containing protein